MRTTSANSNVASGHTGPAALSPMNGKSMAGTAPTGTRDQVADHERHKGRRRSQPAAARLSSPHAPPDGRGSGRHRTRHATVRAGARRLTADRAQADYERALTTLGEALDAGVDGAGEAFAHRLGLDDRSRQNDRRVLDRGGTDRGAGRPRFKITPADPPRSPRSPPGSRAAALPCPRLRRMVATPEGP